MSVQEAPSARIRVTERHGKGFAERIASFRLPEPLLGGLVALLITGVIVRGIILVNGWVEYTADFMVNIHRSTELSQWSTAWNPIIGDDNSAVLSLSPPFLLLIHFMDAGAAEKVLLSLAYFTMAFGSFWAMRAWLREHVTGRAAFLGAVAVSYIYTVNPWVAAESVHLYYLFLYALIPLTFHFVRTALTAKRWHGAAARGAVAGLTTTLTMTAYGILFHSILVTFMLLGFLVAHRPWRMALGRTAVTVVAFAAGLLSTSLYWILPTELGFHADFSSGTSWALFTTKDIYFLSPYTGFADAVRGMYDRASQILVQSLPTAVIWIGMICGFALIAAALWSLLAGRVGRTGWTLAAAGAFFLILANGTGFPVGDRYALLSGAPGISNVAFVLLKGPYKLVPLALFCLIFLAGFGMVVARRSRRGRTAVVTLGAALAAWSVIMGNPLLTGDLQGYMQPLQPPQGYVAAVDRQAASMPSGDGQRTVWLPVDTTGAAAPPSWAPGRTLLPLLSGTVPPLPAWTSAGPISSRGVTWLGPSGGRIFDLFIEQTILDNPNANVAELLRSAGRSDIVVRHDAGDPAGALAQALAARSDMQLVDDNEWIATFRATGSASGGGGAPGVIVGGLDQSAVESARDSGGVPARNYIFSTDVGGAQAPLGRSVLGSAAEVSFAPGKSWSDLALDTWDGPGRIVAAASTLRLTVPLSDWDKDSTDSHTWVPSRLAAYPGQRFDPASGAVAVAGGFATLDIPCQGLHGPHEVWVRAFVLPTGLAVTTSLNDHPLGFATTSADVVQGWRWLNLGVATLDDRARLAVSVQGTSSAIDRIALVPTGAVDHQITAMQEQLATAEITSGGIWSDLPTSPTTIPWTPSQPVSAVAQSGEITVDWNAGRDDVVSMSGRSHPESGYFAVGLKLGRVDWSRTTWLTLAFGEDTTAPIDQLDVIFHDRSGATRRISPLVQTADRQLLVYLPGFPGSKAERSAVDLSSITQIDLAFRQRIEPRRSLQLTLHSITMTGGGQADHQIFVPRDGDYRLMMRTTDADAARGMTVNGKRVIATPLFSGWLTSQALHLDGGSAVLYGNLPDAAYVMLWQPPDQTASVGDFLLTEQGTAPPAQAVATDHYRTAATSEPAALVLLNQPYNGGWTATAGPGLPRHVRVNGVINGWLVDAASGRRPVDIEFTPDRWLLPGRIASVAAVTLVLAVFFVTIALNRRRVRWP